MTQPVGDQLVAYRPGADIRGEASPTSLNICGDRVRRIRELCNTRVRHDPAILVNRALLRYWNVTPGDRSSPVNSLRTWASAMSVAATWRAYLCKRHEHASTRLRRRAGRLPYSDGLADVDHHQVLTQLQWPCVCPTGRRNQILFRSAGHTDV